MTSTIKVDNIQNQCGANIINENSNTITIGASGDTIALASGASQTGFGREGSVNWQTGSLKTSTFTAADGEGYFVNSGSAITMNLPAGSAGAIVAVSDYARNFATYNLTISPNGSEKIGGQAQDATLNVNGQAATFVYVDSTKGWVNVQNAEDTETGVNPFIEATGGTITTCGDFKVHTFTGPGTFAVTTAPTPGNNTADYLVVGGGGSGGGNGGGGGGAGGFRLSNDLCMPAPQTSPLANPTGLTITASTNYPITVGAGGAARSAPPSNTGGNSGNNSIFSTITSAGGGKGGGNNTGTPNSNVGGSGGSGGGSGVINPNSSPTGGGGAGNTPPVSPSQGNNGGTGYSPYSEPYAGGGGGGAGAVGSPGAPGSAPGGAGSFVVQAGFAGCNGTPGPVSGARYFAGGGGAGRCGPGPAVASSGGDGGGAGGINGNNGAAPAGGTNTGGGGGGQGGFSLDTGAGGSGIVVIRYKFQ